MEKRKGMRTRDWMKWRMGRWQCRTRWAPQAGCDKPWTLRRTREPVHRADSFRRCGPAAGRATIGRRHKNKYVYI